MTKQQEFRKQTEEAKFEAFSLMCKKVAELEKENKVLAQNLEDSEIIITGLKSQIEKLKCCYNCRHSRTEYEHCRTDKHEKWEVKEK